MSQTNHMRRCEFKNLLLLTLFSNCMRLYHCVAVHCGALTATYNCIMMYVITLPRLINKASALQSLQYKWLISRRLSHLIICNLTFFRQCYYCSFWNGISPILFKYKLQTCFDIRLFKYSRFPHLLIMRTCLFFEISTNLWHFNNPRSKHVRRSYLKRISIGIHGACYFINSFNNCCMIF